MKKLILLLAVSGCAESVSTTYTPSILVAGQSNAVSMDFEGNMPQSSTIVSINGSYPINIETSITWVLMGNLLGKPLNIDNVSFGGTCINQWVDNQMLEVPFFQADQAKPHKYIVWVQGECDWASGTDPVYYYNSVLSLIQQTHARWIISPTTNGPINNPIALAQFRLIANGYALQGPSIDQLRLDPTNMYQPAPAHLSTKGLQTYAQQWATFFAGRL